LLYRQSVQKLSSLLSLNQSILSSVRLNKTSSDGVEYVCITCSKYLRKNQVPPCSIANCLHFPDIPPHLPALNLAEWRMLSPRLALCAFMNRQLADNCEFMGTLCAFQQMCVQQSTCSLALHQIWKQLPYS